MTPRPSSMRRPDRALTGGLLAMKPHVGIALEWLPYGSPFVVVHIIIRVPL